MNAFATFLSAKISKPKFAGALIPFSSFVKVPLTS
jgi:hypothetical protein